MEREVIVVGAGPGGATAASALAKQGRDVLLIDRQQFPRDKTCGDAIPSGAVEALYDLGMREKFDNAGFFDVKTLLISAREGETLEAPLNTGSKYGSDSYIVPRMDFDVLIQQHAVECGAEFCEGQVKKPLVENGKVVGVQVRSGGKTLDIRSKMVVAADGVTSSITRVLRPKANKHVDHHRAVALRAYIDGLEELPKQVEFYLYKSILPGYAWIFPLGDGKANIGLGMRLDKFRKQDKTLEQMLDTFLAMPFIKPRLHEGYTLNNVATWQLNFGSQKNLQHAYDGALLVGDAAGLINPLTGGGIDNAIISGLLAAQTIDEAFKAGDTSREFLSIYEKRVHDEMWDGMRRAYYFQWTMGVAPFVVRWLIRRMSSDSSFAQAFLSKL
jgi:geranylgeranyl reductase family protein